MARTGLNIPEAAHVLFYDRSWSAGEERQAKARVLRPQQKSPVVVEYFHLPGSVDEPDEFLHIDSVLGRFVSDLATRNPAPPPLSNPP